METIDKWFYREVMQWRTGAAVAWSVLVLPVTCMIYVFMSTLNILYPVQSLGEFLSRCFSWSFISCVILLMVVNTAFFVYSKSTFTVIANVSITRFSQLILLLKAPVILYSSVCNVCGIIIGWICTCLINSQYNGLSVPCAENSDVYCVNEHHIFLVLYGGYTGLMYVVYHYIGQNNVLQFPTLQQAKFFRVRRSINQAAISSILHVFWQIKFFYILYFVFGGIPRDFIADTLSLKYGPGARLDTLYGLLLNFGLFWQTLLVGFFIQFSWSIGSLLYKIYNTEYYEFPIATMFENFKNKCLVDALTCTKLPIVQALGFLDLNILSKHSFTRRKELFCLSQPGGHPHNWNKILSVCISVIQELNDTVQEVNWKILANAPIRQHNIDKSVMNGSSSGLKQRLSSSEDSNVKSMTSNNPSVKEKIVTGLKKRSFLSFFFADTPDDTHKNMFASAYIQIWAVEALSTLVSASYNEDSFGIVQMSLGDIIVVILNLQENIDKHFKLTGGVTRRIQKDNDISLKYSLQTSLKTSIYNIVNTFGRHLLEIDLPVETEKKLRYFLDYRE
ncbi:Nuclear pore complex subunit [Mactra antiquata]